MRASTVTCGLVPPPSLLPQARRITQLYADCFAAPPWNEEAEKVQRFASRLPWLLTRDGMRVATVVAGDQQLAALTGHTGCGYRVLAGYGVGATGGPREPVASHLARQQILRPGADGRPGAPASRLRQAALGALTAGESAWLLTHRDGAGPAFYAAAGWYRATSFTHGEIPLELWIRPGTVSRIGGSDAASPSFAGQVMPAAAAVTL